jgi:formate dehydrogenase subunit delta
MSSTVERLVHMANQIAANLETEDDPARATADHIQSFWDPRMKRLILEHGGEGLSVTAAVAIAQVGKLVGEG